MSGPAARRPFLDLSRDELQSWVIAAGESRFRTDQIRRWVYGKRADSFDAMHDLPKSLREKLDTAFRLFTGEVVEHRRAKDRTEKLLLRLQDGQHVECVLMRERDRRTVCLSSQVGCAMGSRACVTPPSACASAASVTIAPPTSCTSTPAGFASGSCYRSAARSARSSGASCR